MVTTLSFLEVLNAVNATGHDKVVSMTAIPF